MSSLRKDAWVAEVYDAMKCYTRADLLNDHVAHKWPAVKALMNQGSDIVMAIRKVLDQGRQALQVDYPQHAQMLDMQYIQKLPVGYIADHFSFDTRVFHRKRNHAISELAVIINLHNQAIEMNEHNILSEHNLHQINSNSSDQQILSALFGKETRKIKLYLSQYLDRHLVSSLRNHLNDRYLPRSDYRETIFYLHDIYKSSIGTSFEELAIRQNALHLLSEFASLESHDLILSAWLKEKHPWIRRTALIAQPNPEKFEEFIAQLDRDDLARQVARTFPRVFYGDQSYRAGVFLDDHEPHYSQTFWYYLPGYSRYLADPSLALVLYVIRDILQTKGVKQLVSDIELSALMYRMLTIEPTHPLPQKQWTLLRQTVQPILGTLYKSAWRQ